MLEISPPVAARVTRGVVRRSEECQTVWSRKDAMEKFESNIVGISIYLSIYLSCSISTSLEIPFTLYASRLVCKKISGRYNGWKEKSSVVLLKEKSQSAKTFF